jgi:hypothetical protein
VLPKPVPPEAISPEAMPPEETLATFNEKQEMQSHPFVLHLNEKLGMRLCEVRRSAKNTP